jgi:hypothetical protein
MNKPVYTSRCISILSRPSTRHSLDEITFFLDSLTRAESIKGRWVVSKSGQVPKRPLPVVYHGKGWILEILDWREGSLRISCMYLMNVPYVFNEVPLVG